MSEYRHTFDDSDWSLRPFPPKDGFWRTVGYWILYWFCILVLIVAAIALVIGTTILIAILTICDKTTWERFFNKAP